MEVIRLDPDWVSVRNLSDPIPYDCSLDVEPTKSVNSDVELHSYRKEQELVVVASGTFDVHSVDNVEIFSAGLVADVATEELNRSLAEESCRSSCSAGTSKPLASAWDLGDIHSCVDDS